MRAELARAGGGLAEGPGVEIVPGYRLLERLGSGGAGEVWSAEGPGGLRVALKILRPDGGLSRREVANLRILRAIRHPNLLAYFGAWRCGGRLIIGMELADESLWDRLQASRREGLAGIPRAELLDVIAEVARVLDFLNEPCHELDGRSGVSIHHRDVKPQNIMLMGRGVKLADFGLSCTDGTATTSESHCGLTFAYAAPEQFRRHVSTASDQYSLAVSYCQLRGGRLPFTGPPEAVMMGHLFGDPDLSMLPEAERPIVARALAKDFAARWPDCQTFVGALGACAAADVPATLRGDPVSLEHLAESLDSIEITPMSGEWSELVSDPIVPETPIPSRAEDSVYCLDAPASSEGSAADGDLGEGTASPTVVFATTAGCGATRKLSRLDWLAAAVLAAGLVVWCGSERIASLAAREEGPGPIAISAVVDGMDRATSRVDAARSQSHPPVPLSSRESLIDLGTHLARMAHNEFGAAIETLLQARAEARAWLAHRSEAALRSLPAPPVARTPPGRRSGKVPGAGLRVNPPEMLEIEAGHVVSIPFHLDRGGRTEPVSVHFGGLPPGVTIADASIPPGQEQATIDVRARLDAPDEVAMVEMTVRAGTAHASARLRLRIRGNRAMFHRTRGHTLLACGRPAEAVVAFTDAINAGISDAKVYAGRGLANASLNRLDAALEDYAQAIRLCPRDAGLRYDRGLVHARRGDDFRAVLDFDSAIRLDRGDLRAQQARAAIRRKSQSSFRPVPGIASSGTPGKALGSVGGPASAAP